MNRKTENPLLAKMPVYKSNYILLFLDKTTKYQVQELHTDIFFYSQSNQNSTYKCPAFYTFLECHKTINSK